MELQVSGAKTGFKPSLGQFWLYQKFFGYLTAPPGYCKPSRTNPAQQQCHVFAAVNDEFGWAVLSPFSTLFSTCNRPMKARQPALICHCQLHNLPVYAWE